jgi:hypothetical protein
MPVKNSKQRELETYRKLKLGREAKSFRRRELAAEKGLYRYIGEGTAQRPYFSVLQKEYERVWKEEWAKLRPSLSSSAGSGQAHLTRQADLCRLKVERLVYDRLALQQADLQRLAGAFEKQQGRRPTPHEMERFGKSLPVETETALPTGAERAATHRKRWVGEVLSEIQNRHRHHEGRLQQAWATVVGSDVAMEIHLERIDPASGVAVCRCLSSARSHKLRLERDLPMRLSKELGLRVTRILFR